MLGDGEAFFDFGFANVAVVGGAAVEVFVALHGVLLSAEPAVETLLFAIALPHSQQGGELVDGGDAAYDVEHFVVGFVRDAESFGLLVVNLLLGHRR